jgi:hypothetical protein
MFQRQSFNAKREQPRRSIEVTSTSPLNFVYMCVIYVFKRFVFSPVHIKIGIYVTALLVCSVFKDFHFTKHTNYLAQSSNVFNQYFVKFGWAWTLLASLPFVLMTSLVYTGRNLSHVKNHITRVLIATLGWYVFTSIFDFVETKTGQCSNKLFMHKIDCRKNKHEWLYGFDISGHTFILMHSLFLMIEEVKIFHDWELFHRKLVEKLDQFSGGDSTRDLSSSKERLTIDNQFKRAEILYKIFNPFIKFNFVFMALLALLWEAMLLTTFLYYHTMLHKVIAAVCAIGIWFLTYKTWYPSKDVFFSPGLPGDGSI